MSNFFYYLPCFYHFHTRLPGKIKPISLFLTWFLPPFLIVITANKVTPTLLMEYLLSFIGMMSLYEIGYIVNDSFTVFNETNPTERLNPVEQNYCRNHFLVIFSIRFLIFLLIEIIFIIFFCVDISLYSICCVFIVPIFALHNYMRNTLCYFTFFLLNTIKYMVLLVLFLEIKEYLFFYAYLFLSFSLGRTLFYVLKKRHVYLLGDKNLNNIQAFYYFIIFILSTVLYFHGFINFCLFLFTLIFFSYRFSVMWYKRVSRIIKKTR